MTLAAQVRDGLRASGVGESDRLLVAVSGGLDSTVLLRTCAALGRDLVAAHVDHQLRAGGEEDAAFVAALARDLGADFEGLAVEVADGNVQAEARHARYASLVDAAGRHGCRWVVTAHTASDQAETVLAALARGAGLRGLAGMPPARPLGPGVTLVRPLLSVSRTAVRSEADGHGWSWREDASNAGRAYRRNRLRADVMPWLEAELGSGADLRIAASATAARAALGLVQEQLQTLTVGSGRLAVDSLRVLSPDVRSLVFAEAVAMWAPEAVRSASVVARLEALVDAEVGACVESGGLRVWRERAAVRFETSAAPVLDGMLVSTPLLETPDFFPADRFTEMVDVDRVSGSVQVRGWREGDRIQPVGMVGSRLVSDLLRERGVARADRAHVPVVLVEGEVAWVVGHRLSARVAVTAETRGVLEWAWRRSEGAG